MKESEKKQRAKVHQAWLYDQQALTHSVRHFRISFSNNSIYYLQSSGNQPVHQLPVPSIEEQVKTNNPDAIEFWPYTVRNAVMYIPDGKLTKS